MTYRYRYMTYRYRYMSDTCQIAKYVSDRYCMHSLEAALSL